MLSYMVLGLGGGQLFIRIFPGRSRLGPQEAQITETLSELLYRCVLGGAVQCRRLRDWGLLQRVS